jgi:cytochrome c oxidase assembly factor CtaG
MLTHVEAANGQIGVGSGGLDWPLDPTFLMLVGVAALGWLLVVRHVNAAHPAAHVPLSRTFALMAGLAALIVALQSPIDSLADRLFSIHMVQHLLLMYVAAPLLVAAAPVTLLLRFSRPSPRRHLLLPMLHGRLVRAMSAPLVTWLVFIAVMWATHLSPLFELALESQPVHDAEHVLLLGAAVLFWLPVIGREPLPWRLGWSARAAYVALAMPAGSFLGMVIVSGTRILYPHYALVGGAAALDDQRLAGTIMWVGTDIFSLVVLALLIREWLKTDSGPQTGLTRASSDGHLAHPVSAGDGAPLHAPIAAREPDSD